MCVNPTGIKKGLLSAKYSPINPLLLCQSQTLRALRPLQDFRPLLNLPKYMKLFDQILVLPKDPGQTESFKFKILRLKFSAELLVLPPSETSPKMIAVTLALHQSIKRRASFTVLHLKSYPKKVEIIMLKQLFRADIAKELHDELYTQV